MLWAPSGPHAGNWGWRQGWEPGRRGPGGGVLEVRACWGCWDPRLRQILRGCCEKPPCLVGVVSGLPGRGQVPALTAWRCPSAQCARLLPEPHSVAFLPLAWPGRRHPAWNPCGLLKRSGSGLSGPELLACGPALDACPAAARGPGLQSGSRSPGQWQEAGAALPCFLVETAVWGGRVGSSQGLPWGFLVGITQPLPVPSGLAHALSCGHLPSGHSSGQDVGIHRWAELPGHIDLVPGTRQPTWGHTAGPSRAALGCPGQRCSWTRSDMQHT